MKRIAIMIVACMCTLLLTQCGKDAITNPNNNLNSQLAVRVKDAPNLHCDKARVEIKGIKVYSSTKGWITIPMNDTIIDILQLQDTSAFMGYVNLGTGVITQVDITLGAQDTVTVAGINFLLTVTATDIIIPLHDTITTNAAFTLIVDINAAQSIWDGDNDGIHHNYQMNGTGTCAFRHEDHRF